MGADGFTKVFDVTVSGFKDWQFPAFGLIFVAVGTVIFFVPLIIRRLGIAAFDFPSRRLTFFRYGFLGFALFWTAIAFSSTYPAYSRHRDMAAANRCTMVEGPAIGFVPMPSDGHGDESFSVDGVRFSYSDFEATDAFNNTASHGGPVGKDSYLRICYDPADNAILRLEIRDFRKTPKDYAKGDSLFADTGREQQPLLQPGERILQWLGNILVALYFLSFFLTVRMYLPYLRTFWRIKTVLLPVPAGLAGLHPGQRTDLQNMQALWDSKSAAIWLRPRGVNLWRVPAVIARLNWDVQHQAVTSWEVRLPSAVPVILVLFLLSAFAMFAAAMPDGLRVAIIPVGIFAVVGGISTFFQGRRMVGRLGLLVQDALDEVARGARR